MINTAQSEQDIAECRNAEREFFRFARASHSQVALVQHLSLPELEGKYHTGYYANQDVAREQKVTYVDDAAGLRRQLGLGRTPFLQDDPLHLNRLGQAILATALQQAVQKVLEKE